MMFSKSLKNKLFIAACASCLLLVLLPLAWILYEVIYQGISAFSINLLVELPRPPGIAGGGLANFLQGTAILAILASLIGFPVGLFIGVYLSEFKEHWLSRYVRFFVEVFAEFPAIVIGIFVYVLVVRGDLLRIIGIEKLCIGNTCILPTGFSALAGAFSLALIMIPIVARTVEEALNLVPVSIKEAALALGMSKWKATLSISLSYARSGIFTAYILSLSRIIGEAAPLLLTVLGSMYWFSGLYDRIGALPLAIFNYGISPYEDLRAQAWAAALILLIVVLFINIGLKYIIRRRYQW